MSANWTDAAGVVCGGLAIFVSALALLRAHYRGEKEEASDLGALETRVEALERRADAMDLVAQSLGAKVELLPAMDEKLKGIDRLVTQRLNTVETTLGRLEGKLDRLGESRSFKSQD
jgi:hypothetical protein